MHSSDIRQEMVSLNTIREASIESCLTDHGQWMVFLRHLYMKQRSKESAPGRLDCERKPEFKEPSLLFPSLGFWDCFGEAPPDMTDRARQPRRRRSLQQPFLKQPIHSDISIRYHSNTLTDPILLDFQIMTRVYLLTVEKVCDDAIFALHRLGN
jgi:hypothetical protein